jgi:hypothetical protein
VAAAHNGYNESFDGKLSDQLRERDLFSHWLKPGI